MARNNGSQQWDAARHEFHAPAGAAVGQTPRTVDSTARNEALRRFVRRTTWPDAEAVAARLAGLALTNGENERVNGQLADSKE